jgi:hypothetical protein
VHANIDFFRYNLEKLKDSGATNLAEHFRSTSEKQDGAETMKGIETLSSSANKKPHYVKLKWIARAIGACLLAGKLSLDYAQG